MSLDATISKHLEIAPRVLQNLPFCHIRLKSSGSHLTGDWPSLPGLLLYLEVCKHSWTRSAGAPEGQILCLAHRSPKAPTHAHKA